MLSLLLDNGVIYCSEEPLIDVIKDMIEQGLTAQEMEDIVAGWVGSAYALKMMAKEEENSYEKLLMMQNSDISVDDVLRGFQGLAEDAEEMYPGICKKCEIVAKKYLVFAKTLTKMYEGDPDLEQMLKTTNLA